MLSDSKGEALANVQFIVAKCTGKDPLLRPLNGLGSFLAWRRRWWLEKQRLGCLALPSDM